MFRIWGGSLIVGRRRNGRSRRSGWQRRLENGLNQLERLRGRLVPESRRRATTLRACHGCGECCRHPANAMRASRLEAVALLRRLERDPLLRGRRAELLDRTRRAIRHYGLTPDEDQVRGYTCPFFEESDGGRCLVHGIGQPLGCVAYRPVGPERCELPLDELVEVMGEVGELNHGVFGSVGEALLIPVAVDRAAKLEKSEGGVR